jgi:hypothetical protein
MSQPIFAAIDPNAVDDQAKEHQTRRAKALPAMAGKLVQDAAALQEGLRLFEYRVSEEDARVLKILRVAFGDKVEKTLKNHPALDDLDRSFLRERKGWRV